MNVRTLSSRLALLGATFVLAFVEAQDLVRVVGTPSRLRERLAAEVRERMGTLAPRLASMANGPRYQVLDLVLRETGASETELFDDRGRLLDARPGLAPTRHWLSEAEVKRLRAGEMVTVGPFAGSAGRLLTYAALPGMPSAVLRIAILEPALVDDTRDRHELVLHHAAALVILILMGGFALMPGRESSPSSSSAALEAYAAAMERLRDHGAVVNRQHTAALHRLQEQIEDNEAMARAGELTAGVVHEFRNGLGTILGYTRLLDRVGGDGDVADAARGIRDECATLETIVRRFIEFVRRETLNVASFDLQRMLTRVAARESRAREGPEVAVDVADRLDVSGDEELLERAFENLVRNARDAAGAHGHVWVHAGRIGADVEVTVTDDGPGFSPAARERLRPFETNKVGGLGLGLPLALKIVNLHGGTLAFEDRAPRGLRARVRWPVSVPNLNGDVTNGSEDGGGQPPAEGGDGV